MPHPFTNSLVHETSPYLLQHAHNPVEWFAWGPEALSKAKQEDKLILVSIGYSACHWCHVMERESFENEATAAVMNRHFVNIKVDREERPDLDHIYMDAVQAISGAGGWPLNVFLTPDAKPFFGGTYFPPVRAFNRSSWTEVLEALSTAWAERKEEIRSQAENLVNHLQQSNSFGLANGLDGRGDINKEQCDEMFSAIMKSADKVWGGFGKAPKFPQTFTIRYLLHYHHFTGNTEALEQALLSIDKMLEGGIYDHIGGGLARYSTDGEWLAPHFEKMLYDNALLIIVLCDAYQLTRERKYEEATRSIINFVLNEFSEASGGFYAALDADSEGEEGRYYVWQEEEIEEVLGPDAKLFCTYFDVTDKGNWEGKNILHTLKPAPVFTREKGLDLQDFEQLIGKCIEKLAARRAGRVRPALDDKCILGWNALMMSAIAKASTVLGDDSYREVAERNFNFLTANFGKQEFSSELFHTFKHKRAKYPAFLDDYAYLIAALLQLYKTTLELSYLERSYEYCRYVVENFSDDDAVFFFFTHKGQKDVILRKKEIYDGAVPSGNAVMAENLYELAIIFDRPDWTSRADKMLGILLPTVVKYPGSFGIWARLTLQRLAGVNEVAVIGTEFALFSQKILLSFIPNLVLMSSPIEKEAFPLLAGKNPGASTQVYLCKNYTCLAPFPGIEPLLEQIDKTNKLRR